MSSVNLHLVRERFDTGTWLHLNTSKTCALFNQDQTELIIGVKEKCGEKDVDA